jgi:dihydropyrimidinase
MLLIQGGTLISAVDSYPADILVDGGKIAMLGLNLPAPAGTQVVDANGKLIMPGGVDVHAHFSLPMTGTVSSDDHYTGHKAAAFGGTTTVIDFVSQERGALRQNVDTWHAVADDKAAVDFSFHMNISRFDAAVAVEIPHLIEEGITSLKVFMAYANLRLTDGDIFKVLRIAAEQGFLTMLHAEGGDVIDILRSEALAHGQTSTLYHALTRPPWTAVEATLRGAALAAQAGAPLYVVHLNAGGEVDMLEYARQKGVQLMGETCPQYLSFTQENLTRPDGAKWICSPPLRAESDTQRLWQGLQEGILQVVATDHCAFFYDGSRPIQYEGKQVAIPGKELGKDDFTRIPSGVPGVGDRLPVLWTKGVVEGRLTPSQFVALTATNPAKIFGLYPQKGVLLPGSDADFLIWDAKRIIRYGVDIAQHRTDYNLYQNWHLTGFPEKVFLRGFLIVDDGRWLGSAGMGRYLHRKAHNPVI